MTACHHALYFVRQEPRFCCRCPAFLSRTSSRRATPVEGSPIAPDSFGMLLARPVAGAIGAQRPISAASTSERHAGLNLRVKLPGLSNGRRSRSKPDAALRLPLRLGVAFGRCTTAPPQPLQGGCRLPAERRVGGPFAISDGTSLAAGVATRSSSSTSRSWRRLGSCSRVTLPAPRRQARPPWWRASTEGAARLNPGQARVAACRWKVSILRLRWSSWPHGDWPVE